MKKILLIVAVTVIALGALGVGIAFAQEPNPPYPPMMGGRGGYGPIHDYVEKELASRLGLTEEQVEQELTAGKPMPQIALDHGIQQANLPAFLAEVHQAAFAAAVKDGVMTQAQADFMLQHMAQNGYNYGNCPMTGAGSANGYGRGRGMMGGAGMMGGRWQNVNP